MTHAAAIAAVLLMAAAAAAQTPAPPLAAPEPSFEAPQEDPREVVGAPRGTRLAGAALDTRTEEVGALLRCPVCQGLSIADSPASMATKMKARVRELLAEGYDEEQILAYFERSYGEFVRLEPPRRGINWLVWLLPPAALLAGLGFVIRAMRRRSNLAPREDEFISAERAGGLGGATVAPLSSMRDVVPQRDTLPADSDLAPYVLRVREIAYGWPGGRPPADAP